MSIRDGCGSRDCCVSTSIFDDMTFGSGRLDDNGFWELPCLICETAWRASHRLKEEEQALARAYEDTPWAIES